jgi:RNA polymerase sigma-B factor
MSSPAPRVPRTPTAPRPLSFARAAPLPDTRFEEYRATGDRRIRNALVEDHRPLAMHCLRPFRRKGVPTEDLHQVAMVGLVEAVDRFDPSLGHSFTTFAMPTIKGELRRYFRDRAWLVRVGRTAQQNHLLVRDAREELSQSLGRPPTMAELATRCGITLQQTVEAHDIGHAYWGTSIDSGGYEDEAPHDRRFGIDESGYDLSEVRVVLPRLLAVLPSDRERRIIKLRFVDDMTQAEIAQATGLSQVHISRLLRQSLHLMRAQLTA